MANIRQYIGARYVFKIYENSQDPSSAEWEPNVTYEPLTIVTYLNSTYASKKDVPGSVGNPAANPQYWIVTGAYNGQIATLQQQLDDMKDGTINGSLQNQIDTVNNVTIPAINATIGDLNDLDVPASSVVEALNNVAKPKYVFITDSYGDPIATGGDNTLITRFRDLLGLVENDDITSIYQGGAGFVSDGTKTFINMLNTVIARFSGSNLNFTADEVTHVIVVGGDNDNAALTNPLVTAVGAFISAAKTAFPNAKIYVGEVGNVSNNQSVHLAIAKTVLPAYQRCTEYGGIYLSGVEKVMLQDSMFTADGIHPTSSYGTIVMATAIIEALNGCHTQTYYTDGDITSTGNDFGSTSGAIHAWGCTDGDTTTIMLNGALNTDGRSLVQFSTYKLGTLPANFGFVHGGGTYGYGESEVTINFGSEGVKPALLFVDGKDIKLMPYEAMTPSGVQCVTAIMKFPTQFN